MPGPGLPDDVNWIPARDAQAAVAQQLRKKPAEASSTIMTWCLGELVQSAATRVVEVAANGQRQQVDKARLMPTFWKSILNGNGDHDWSSGIFSAHAVNDQHPRGVQHIAYGVAFDKDQLEAQLPAAASSPRVVRLSLSPDAVHDLPGFGTVPGQSDAIADAVAKRLASGMPSEVLKHAGGRPRKDFWEPLLIAAGIALYGGDLKPKTMAEVERWMADWLSHHGHDAGEVSIRDRARLFFNAYKAERDRN